MSEVCRIIDEPADIDRRLAELGLVQSWLVAAVLSGDAGASTSTALHPPNDAGFRRWADSVAELRMQSLPHGWRHSNELNYCTIFNQQTRTAVAIMAGDELTGSRLGAPRSRYPKGVLTRMRININNGQGSLFPSLKTPNEIVEQDCTTWTLVQCAAEDGIHAELSLPRRQNERGHVVDYAERILLPAIDPRGGALAGTSNDPGQPDVDFDVHVR